MATLLRRTMLLATAAVFAITLAQPVRAESVRGQVVDEQGRSIPGLRVRLLNAEHGVSRPRYTDRQGRFEFSDVPRSSRVYYLEIHWGGTLVYRRHFRFPSDGDLDLNQIRLQPR